MSCASGFVSRLSSRIRRWIALIGARSTFPESILRVSHPQRFPGESGEGIMRR
jgi:hypothetical protein